MRNENRSKINILHKVKKHWALIWLLVAIAGTGAFFAFADYTGLTSVKRVVTTVAAPGELFSSNSMRASLSNHRLTRTEYTVTVCNYEQDDPNTFNPSDISYTLYAEINVLHNGEYLTMSELQIRFPDVYTEKYALIGNRTYSIKRTMENGTPRYESAKILNASNNFSATYTECSLTKDVSSTSNFLVTFDSAEAQNTSPDFYIHISATPTSGSSQKLEGRLYSVKNTSEASAWRGTFRENDYATTDYDFYNYTLSGSGVGIVEITWNPAKFAINPFFFGNTDVSFKAYSDEEASGGERSYDNKVLTIGEGANRRSKTRIKVNSSLRNYYEFQLYKTETESSYTGSNSADNHISCVFLPGME